jgi:hypothetical protein
MTIDETIAELTEMGTESERERNVDGWPENDAAAVFDTLTEPVADLVRQAYSLKRKAAIKKGLDWKGPSLPWSLRASCLPFEEKLNAENLRYDDEEQGRDPLEVIIGIAVQLGIEQGRRISAEPIADKEEMVGHYLKMALERLES